MKHLIEHQHAFVRSSDNRVVQVATFLNHDIDNIEGINRVVEGDTYIVCGCNAGQIPPLHSVWNGTIFIPADTTYLRTIGLFS